MTIQPNMHDNTSSARSFASASQGETDAPECTIQADSARRFLLVRCPDDAELTQILDKIEGRRFLREEDNNDPHWMIPIQSAYALYPLIKEHGFAAEKLIRRLIKREYRQRHFNLENSAATDADIYLGEHDDKLFPFQRVGVAYTLRNRRTFIADSMGLGKTVMALVSLEAAEAYPALIVTPASVKLNWGRETAKWLPNRKMIVWDTDGRHPRKGHDIVIVNYDLLGKFRKAYSQTDWKAIVMDESHYLKDRESQRSKHCRDLAEGTEYRLMLTGTPLLNRPIELTSQLEIMGRLDEFGGFLKFARRYCGAGTMSGWDQNGATHLDELNHKLRAMCYLRREKADVLSELPPKQRHIVTVPLSNRRAYEKAQTDLATWYTKAGSGNDRQARRAEALTRIAKLRQIAAQGKVAAVIEWTQNLLDSGEKLVLFAYHTAIVNALADHFSAPRITGNTPLEERQAAVDRFQADPSCTLIVGNVQAMGQGLTLTAAANVAFAELGWTPALHEQAEDRVHRIGQASGRVTAWYLIAPDTFDEAMMRLLRRKRKVIAQATQGE